MLDFLKKLYEQRLKEITVILLDDSRPGEDNSYQFRPTKFFAFLTLVCVMLSMFVALIFMLTPLGALLYSKEDAEMRAQVENITQRVIALQDSLIVRDYQLSEMKDVIRLSVDTTLAMDDRFSSMFDNDQQLEDLFANRFDDNLISERVSTSGIIFSNIFKAAPDFPTSFPVNGSLTRGYEPENAHYGIDVATKEEELITSIADGTIVSASWTISDGYVISVQHAGGLLSVYKHCSSLTKKSGDVILKGDIIGATGDVGVSSSGPHLHLEIWKDGLPQDPAIYLIQ
ncbi:MAG: peptidoglycan DD-metalloendopeptidase family protein [Balneolaceae bacterium]|nr:peptidoglycan DD-metalloendopeptidase family protein [Balneolaceae bacterium]MBO6547405.1 peptidoglycan DD-metalloendopeptidase family protein [Balneolaceae bacterium]MBO6647648.1 peptidoglycan DD-metalloendopeptidase family protein [Balneolaceae bacterium]